MSILLSSLLNIHPLTTVNGNICYEIETKDCPVRYVFALQSTTFIAMKHDDVIHIFNLKQSGVFTDEFKEYIEQIRGKIYEFFFNPMLTIGEHLELWHEINDNSHNFAIIRQNTSSSHRCEPFIDLSNAKIIVRQLNAALQPICPNFHLNIDYITSFPANSTASLYHEVRLNTYFQPPLALCLFTGNNCVSSIAINVTESEMTIDSKTNELYLKRNFNTLLRAVAIIVSTSINERAERLVSSAANVISALVMIKRFNAVLRNGDISKFTISPEKLDKVINDYFAHHGNMETYVELNEVNIKNATAVFHETIPRMNCEPLEEASAKGGRRKKYTRKVVKKSKKHIKRSNKHKKNKI